MCGQKVILIILKRTFGIYLPSIHGPYKGFQRGKQRDADAVGGDVIWKYRKPRAQAASKSKQTNK